MQKIRTLSLGVFLKFGIIVLFLLFTIGVRSELFMEINENHEVYSKNKKVRVKLFPFTEVGVEGRSYIYKDNKCIYTVNEFARDAVVSDDGEYLVLFRKEADLYQTDKFVMNNNILTIFKNGALVKKYAVKDFFEFKMSLALGGTILEWLGREYIESRKVAQLYPIKFNDLDKLNVSLINGYDLVIDLKDGQILSKKINRPSYRPFNYNDKVSAKGKNKISKFIKFIESYNKFSIDEISYFGELIGTFKESIYCELKYKVGDMHVLLHLKVQDFKTFELEFPRVLACINDYYEINRQQDPTFECALGCYLTYTEDISIVSAYDPRYITVDNLDYLKDTFFVRKTKGFNFIDMPFIVIVENDNNKKENNKFKRLATVGGIENEK